MPAVDLAREGDRPVGAELDRRLGVAAERLRRLGQGDLRRQGQEGDGAEGVDQPRPDRVGPEGADRARRPPQCRANLRRARARVGLTHQGCHGSRVGRRGGGAEEAPDTGLEAAEEGVGGAVGGGEVRLGDDLLPDRRRRRGAGHRAEVVLDRTARGEELRFGAVVVADRGGGDGGGGSGVAEHSRADHVPCGGFRVLRRTHAEAVLDQDRLEAGAGAAEAVDHQPYFLFGAFVFPADELEGPLGAADVVVGREDRKAFAFDFDFEEFPFVVEQEGVEISPHPVPGLGPLQVEQEFVGRFHRDTEGVVASRPGVEIHAVGRVQALRIGVFPFFFRFFDLFREFDDRRRAGSGVAEFRRFPGGDVAAFGVDQVVVAGGREIGGAAGRRLRRRRPPPGRPGRTAPGSRRRRRRSPSPRPRQAPGCWTRRRFRR